MVDLPLKPDGRTLAYFGQLKPAEQKLLDACRSGETAVISEQRPEHGNDNNIIVRASFLRFLALGGDEHAPVHEKGVLLYGAWVEGELNLQGTILPHSLGLINCHLKNVILHYSDVHKFVSFQGSYVEGLAADLMKCSGSVILRNFVTTDKVSLTGAKIGGDLECDDGKFDGNGDNALVFERTVIKGSVFLRNINAIGTVCLLDTQIGGSLECANSVLKDIRSGEKYVGALVSDRAVIKGGVFLNGKFTATGKVSLNGVQIGGNLDCSGATFDGRDDFALAAEGMMVAGKSFFCDLQYEGVISLVGAKVGSLVDDVKSWEKGRLDLGGFVYDRLAGSAPTNAKNRLKWLDKQISSHAGLTGDGKDFKPQPWQQLQKVLREMGHIEDARQVAIAFEKRLLRANLIGQTPKDWCKPTAWVYRKISRGFHRLFGWLIGYGYRPLGLFFKMVVVWLLCGAFYWCAALNGVFAPSNPLVFQNTEYAACIPDSCEAKVEKVKLVYATLQELIKPNNPLIFQNTEYAACMSDTEAAKPELSKLACAVPPLIEGAGNWYLCSKLPEEYTGFSPLAYSLDLILPLVDLQQEHDWAPRIPTPKDTWPSELSMWCLKHFTRFVVWLEILFGWMSSLLLVAVVSGLTKRRDE